ncbi:MAG TPA: FHA domain-containing protein [Cellvibrionaceae bacterium]
MAIIIEHTDPSGHVLRQQRFETTSVSIGRSFSADMILTDPYVDAEHCTVACDTDTSQLRLKDLGAKNGLWWLDNKHHKQRVISERAIASGQTILLGKTYLRIYHHSHAVPQALSIARDDAITGFFGHAGLILVVAVLALGLDILGQYLDHPIGGSWVERGREAFYGLLGLIALSSFWALLGKGLVQHARFRFHLGLSFCVMAVWVVWEFIQPSMMYNLNFTKATADWLNRGLQAVVLGGALYLALSFSTRLSTRVRALLAGLVPLLVLGSGLSTLIETKNRFRPVPPYSHVLVEPTLQWRSPAAWDTLPAAAEKAYKPYDPHADDTDADVSDDTTDESPDPATTAEE